MPRALTWSSDLDEKLVFLLDKKKMTLRNAAKVLGVSRSFIHRKSQKIQHNTHFKACSIAREQAGFEPLAVGHPISWRAIETRRQSMLRMEPVPYHAKVA
ncbi:hypothetical protein [Acetobacter fallax]|uniref:Uncharacterized protein n=1 Tax=Acetobacter fallax TaxID=1737473 RepID=A0ABX0KC82_9PROT|nr:hypothetical protein [Acetobacter fallax]NHO32473.1 hypothetical protein [Acetobacter fallax]NHO36033.1 hypothetical protein [Acetobacter fallax]